MKNVIFIVLGLCTVVLFGCRPSIAQSSLGNKNISYSGKENADDLKVLSGYNFGKLSITKVSGDLQAFHIASKDGNTEIKYTSQNSLDNAIYYLLDQWGFHWYGPSSYWFVQPSNKTIKVVNQSGKWIKPSFEGRSFFGTGGLDVPIPGDNGFYKKNWLEWKRRLRINATYGVSGHTGQVYYLENKKLLDANPSWFNSESGKQMGRFRIEIPAAVKAYKDWIRKSYEAQKNNDAIVLGVDPEDGRGGQDDPLPPNGFDGIKNWNHADKWWWLANSIAKDYEFDKRVKVQMYAYGDGSNNAKLPKFSLHAQVMPIIIPYAFQTAYQPDEMVRVWANGIKGNMGIYDYWNITQWSLGLPQFNLFVAEQRLKFWTQSKINYVTVETTDAAGPMGHGWWLMSHKLFNVQANMDSLLTQYTNDCFGKAGPILKQMYLRWSNNYQGAGEVALMAKELEEAAALIKKGTDEEKRLNDVKAYAEFMRLIYEHDKTQASKDNIFKYLFSINNRMLVQTSAFLGQYYLAPLDKGNIVNAREAKILDDSKIQSEFLQRRKSIPAAYKVSNFKFDYSKAKALEPIKNDMWNFGNFSCIFFFYPNSQQVKLTIGALSPVKFTILNDKGMVLSDSIGNKGKPFKLDWYPGVWKLKDFSFQTIPGERYEYRSSYGDTKLITEDKSILFFKNPGDLDFDNYAYPVQYFYVPSDIDEIVFFDAEPEGTNGRGYLIAPDGTVLKRSASGLKNTYKVPVKKEWKNKVWKANFGHPSWKLMNIPNISTLQNFEYKN